MEEQNQPEDIYIIKNEDTYSFDDGINSVQEIQVAKEKISQFLDATEPSKKSLVDLERCLKELHILKEKDMEIDNRFRKFNKSRADLQ